MPEHNTYEGTSEQVVKKQNRIITRGFGPLLGGSPGQAGPITQGYTALYTLAGGSELALLLVQKAYGRSGKEKREIKEDDVIIVKAKMIGINDDAIKAAIQGSTTTPIVRSLARMTVQHIKKQILVSVKRILR